MYWIMGVDQIYHVAHYQHWIQFKAEDCSENYFQLWDDNANVVQCRWWLQEGPCYGNNFDAILNEKLLSTVEMPYNL